MTQAADLKLAAVFSDHMVLQRELPIAVWGWADPGESVTVSFAGKSGTARRAKNGKWTIQLDPLPASAEPRTLVAMGERGRKVEVRDVVVGEVWLCAGQSNMAMTVDGPTKWLHVGAGIANAKDVVRDSANPLLRQFAVDWKTDTVPQQTARENGASLDRTPRRNFSATGYFFARELQQRLKVPVGILKRVVRGFIGGRLDEPRGTHEIRGCRVRWENEPAHQ